jgi:hypothetical protein
MRPRVPAIERSSLALDPATNCPVPSGRQYAAAEARRGDLETRAVLRGCTAEAKTEVPSYG